jgi:hypothetical protein
LVAQHQIGQVIPTEKSADRVRFQEEFDARTMLLSSASALAIVLGQRGVTTSTIPRWFWEARQALVCASESWAI